MSLVLRSVPEARVTFFSSRQTHCKQIFVRSFKCGQDSSFLLWKAMLWERFPVVSLFL